MGYIQAHVNKLNSSSQVCMRYKGLGGSTGPQQGDEPSLLQGLEQFLSSQIIKLTTEKRKQSRERPKKNYITM